MDPSCFIVLLARQRSGTNALRSVLGSHKDIFRLGEPFSVADSDSEVPLLRDTNFFRFMQDYGRNDIKKLFPDNHERLFLDFLDHLRGLSEKRYILADVKYNTTHFLTERYKPELAPYLFRLIKKHGLFVLNLTRKNYLRFLVSQLKAERSGIWRVDHADQAYTDDPILIDLDSLHRLRLCFEEDQMVHQAFSSYPHYLTYDYEEVFPRAGGGIADQVLAGIAAKLGIENSFEDTQIRKQSHLPLSHTILNFDEVAAALRGTRFEYCLEDEEIYSHAPLLG